MPLLQRIAILLAATALVLAAAYLVRERRLRRSYGLVWGAMGLVLLVFGLAPSLFETVGAWFGLGRAGFMAALCILALLGVAVWGSVRLSALSDREDGRTDETAGLREEIERLHDELKEARRPQPEQKPKPPALRT